MTNNNFNLDMYNKTSKSAERILTLFPFMKNVLGNHGTKYMPSTTLGEIKNTITKLHNEIETCKKKYDSIMLANGVMIEELKAVDEIMPKIQKCLGDTYTEEDKNEVVSYIDDYLDTAGKIKQ